VALTSFFFTFFKVFLNGFLGLLSRRSNRLMNPSGADKLFFHFFQSFFERPKNRNLRRSTGSFCYRIARMAASKNWPKSAPNFFCQRKAIVLLSVARCVRPQIIEISDLATLHQLALIRAICGPLNPLEHPWPFVLIRRCLIAHCGG